MTKEKLQGLKEAIGSAAKVGWPNGWPNGSLKNIAAQFGVSTTTVTSWRKRLFPDVGAGLSANDQVKEAKGLIIKRRGKWKAGQQELFRFKHCPHCGEKMPSKVSFD